MRRHVLCLLCLIALLGAALAVAGGGPAAADSLDARGDVA
jgi:hypothetical protein